MKLTTCHMCSIVWVVNINFLKMMNFKNSFKVWTIFQLWSKLSVAKPNWSQSVLMWWKKKTVNDVFMSILRFSRKPPTHAPFRSCSFPFNEITLRFRRPHPSVFDCYSGIGDAQQRWDHSRNGSTIQESLLQSLQEKVQREIGETRHFADWQEKVQQNDNEEIALNLSTSFFDI